MTTPRLAATLACLVLTLGVAAPATAERPAVCRRSCTTAIEACARSRPSLKPARVRRQCRKELLRACKQGGTSACALVASPPTTTTLGVTPPTTLGATTTTTTTRPPTTTVTSSTTTTIVEVYDFGGTWLFTGAPSTNTCPGSVSGLRDTFTVVQTGVSVSVTIGSVPGLVMRGTVDARGLEASGTTVQDGCDVEIALVASPDGTITVTAATGFDITCGTASCRVIWVGSMTRL